MRRRSGRKRARAPMASRSPTSAGAGLSVGCVADGRRFRILAIVDDFTRECLVLVPIRHCPACGSPASLTPSSLSAVVQDDRFRQRHRAHQHGDAALVAGASVDFNGRLRDELLNETLFSSLAHAREVLSLWKDDYNTVRPHSGLGNLTPAAYAKRSAPEKQRDGTLRYTEGSAPRPVASPSQMGSNQPGTLPIAG